MAGLRGSLVVPDPSPPPEPNDIPTYTNNKLEIDHKIDPDLPLSQPEVKQHHIDASTKLAKNSGMTTMDVGCPSGEESKMATKEVVGQGFRIRRLHFTCETKEQIMRHCSYL